MKAQVDTFSTHSLHLHLQLNFIFLLSFRLQNSLRDRSTRSLWTTGASGPWCLSVSQDFALSYQPGSLFLGITSFQKFQYVKLGDLFKCHRRHHEVNSFFPKLGWGICVLKLFTISPCSNLIFPFYAFAPLWLKSSFGKISWTMMFFLMLSDDNLNYK